MIGHLADESSARTFADYLYVQGIENQLDHQKDDGWGIWILDEDKKSVTVTHRDGSVLVYRAGESIPLTAFGSDSHAVDEIFACS